MAARSLHSSSKASERSEPSLSSPLHFGVKALVRATSLAFTPVFYAPCMVFLKTTYVASLHPLVDSHQGKDSPHRSHHPICGIRLALSLPTMLLAHGDALHILGTVTNVTKGQIIVSTPEGIF